MRLTETIRAKWKFGHLVELITQHERKWSIDDHDYDGIVIASSVLPQIQVPQFAEIEEIWKSIPRNSAIVVAFGFPGLSREGFGWLVPAGERHSILACTYVSNKFPKRSPEDLFLVRCFIGGDNAADWIHRSDQEIQSEVRRELARIAAITGEPSFCRIFRWQNAMPEYQVGHSEKIARLHSLIGSHRGLAITGNLFNGVGLPDCIQHAEQTVSAFIASWR